MMGNWTDIRSNGRLMARIDTERRLLELVRNGEQLLVDLDTYIGVTTMQATAEQPARPGPNEVKADSVIDRTLLL